MAMSDLPETVADLGDNFILLRVTEAEVDMVTSMHPDDAARVMQMAVDAIEGGEEFRTVKLERPS